MLQQYIRLSILLLCCFILSAVNAQTSYKPFQEDWQTYNIKVGTIRLPSYIKPLSALEDKMVKGVAKGFELGSAPIGFKLMPDDNLEEQYKDSYFNLSVGFPALSLLNQSTVMQAVLQGGILEKLGKMHEQTAKEKFSKIGAKLLKSYQPKVKSYLHFATKESSYTAIVTKYIIDMSPLYTEPIAFYNILIPNGAQSIQLEVSFPVYESDFWFDQMNLFVDEFVFNKVVK